MTFASVDSLAGVVAAYTTRFGSYDTQAVDDWGTRLWDIEYLPFHMPLNRYVGQLRLAVRATRQPMHDDMLRLRYLHQGAPFVPALSTTRPLARLAQTLAPFFLQTIAAGQLATVVTSFRQLILQLLDQLLLCCQLLLQKQNQLDQVLLL